MMNLNWLGILSAALAVVAFLVTHRVLEKKSVRIRVIVSLLSIVAAIPALSFSVYYAHVFPELGWYFEFRSLVGTELLIVFLGIAGGAVASLLPRILVILPLLGVVVFSVVPFIKPMIGPIRQSDFEDDWDAGICLQTTPSTCGLASTATILRYFGGDETEAELAAEAHTYSRGTEAWYLARAIRSRGLDVSFDFKAGFLPEEGLPAVVGVRLGSIGHFIAIVGMENDKFVVGDPLEGRELMTLEELNQRYVFTGFHMRVSKQE